MVFKRSIIFFKCLNVAILIFGFRSNVKSCHFVLKDSTQLHYVGTDEIFANPERGFIHTYSSLKDGNKLNDDVLKSLKNEHVSTILRIVYLEEFKSKPISRKKIKLIANDLKLLRDQGLKVILRFAYTDSIEGKDAPLDLVLRHIAQLGSLIRGNEDIIAYLQAGFIGAWGEWHSSSNSLTDIDKERIILFKLLQEVPHSIKIQVRTPLIKQQIFGLKAPIKSNHITESISPNRVGHHNDCFLSNDTDYGTYSAKNVNDEKAYISEEGLYVPVGGETCPPTDNFDPNCARSQSELAMLKWSYLNLDWYGPTLNIWKNLGCFLQIQRQLGYRFRLVSTELPLSAKRKQKINVKIMFSNNGYAPIYQKKNCSLILRNKINGQSKFIDLNIDLRLCKPSEKYVYEEQVEIPHLTKGDYEVYLSIRDNSSKLKLNQAYNVRLANQDVWIKEKGWNDLHRILTIIQ